MRNDAGQSLGSQLKAGTLSKSINAGRQEFSETLENDTELLTMCGMESWVSYLDIKEKGPKKPWGLGNFQHIIINLIFALRYAYLNHIDLPQWSSSTCCIYISPVPS